MQLVQVQWILYPTFYGVIIMEMILKNVGCKMESNGKDTRLFFEDTTPLLEMERDVLDKLFPNFMGDVLHTLDKELLMSRLINWHKGI